MATGNPPPLESAQMQGEGTILGYSQTATEWLYGAIDMHVHGYPELSLDFRSRDADIDTIKLAIGYGVRGWVLKSHLWPTTDRVQCLKQQLGGEPFSLFSSITLNPLLGGISSFTVEAAAAHGAKIVFMPTWGSTNEKPDSFILGLLNRYMPSTLKYAEHASLSALDESGRLSRDTQAVVKICQERDLVLCTGHISPIESLEIVKYAETIGYGKVVVTHPLSYVSNPQDLLPYVERGATIELPNAGTLNPRNNKSIRDIYQALTVLGPDNCILTTDVFSPWVPPQPECLRLAVQQLAFLGSTQKDIQTIISTNPRTLLGIGDAVVIGDKVDSQLCSQ